MNIALLDAALLGGLVTIGLPTLVHLLSRRRARRVRFAPMELLLRSQKRTARSIRLRQFLLLLVRTLFVFGLAAAVLRPLLTEDAAASSTTAPVAVVVAVDISASMQARLDGRSAFERAKARAAEAITALPDDVRVGLVACDVQPRDLVLPGFDRGGVVAALDALTVGAAWADVAACAERAAGLATSVEVGAENDKAERRVVLVSDFAAHGFSRAAVGGVDAAGLRVDLVPAFDEPPPPNHGIVDVEVVPGAQGLGVNFTAARYGGPAVEVTADLFINDARGARLALPMTSGVQLQRAFTAPNMPVGDSPQAGTLSVALGDDALAIDNLVVLPNEARPSVRVLVVDGEMDAVPFADEVFYLTQALSSSRVGAAGQSRVSVSVVPPEKLDAASFAAIDVVVVANVARIAPAVAAALTSFANAGGGVLLTMGDQVDVDAWNADLAGLLPAVLRGTKRQALLDDASVDDVLGLSRFKLDHPILRAFAGTGDDALPGLTRVRTSATMLVEPDPNAPRDILARFTNDAPALIERAVGDTGAGRVLLLTTSIDREWSDLPIRPGFLPLVEQIVLYLGRALDDERARTVHVGDARSIRLPQGATAAVVTRPDGAEVTVDLDDTGAAASFTDTSRTGLHQVAARLENGDRVELPRERFTVLVDAREIDLTRISDDALKASLPSGAVVRRTLGEHNGEPLWPWLLLIAVVALLVESALVRKSGSAG
jgi:hypothetical protein